jgi:hypothetical protein
VTVGFSLDDAGIGPGLIKAYRGTVMEIAARYGGAEKLRAAMNEMQAWLYS